MSTLFSKKIGKAWSSEEDFEEEATKALFESPTLRTVVRDLIVSSSDNPTRTKKKLDKIPNTVSKIFDAIQAGRKADVESAFNELGIESRRSYVSSTAIDGINKGLMRVNLWLSEKTGNPVSAALSVVLWAGNKLLSGIKKQVLEKEILIATLVNRLKKLVVEDKISPRQLKSLFADSVFDFNLGMASDISSVLNESDIRDVLLITTCAESGEGENNAYHDFCEEFLPSIQKAIRKRNMSIAFANLKSSIFTRNHFGEQMADMGYSSFEGAFLFSDREVLQHCKFGFWDLTEKRVAKAKALLR
jgi:hypothetical protein